MGDTELRAVFFDLDGTLLDYGEDAWAQTVHVTCAGLAREEPGLDTERLSAAYRRICLTQWEAASAAVRAPSGAVNGASSGHAIWRELWHRALVECGHSGDRPAPDGPAQRAMELYRDDRMRRYRLYDDVADTLAAVRARVGPLALITNGPVDTQREKLAATGLDRIFEVVLVSGEVGVAKPDERIFELALRALGVEPRVAWHVGDSMVSDVAGAHRAGLGAGVWLNRGAAARPPDGPAPGHEIASLTELVSLIA
jgi:HAD superfamily hydrolase (TIGR01549 family)